MANGDAAAAAGMAVMNGSEDRRMGWDEENKTRDYIAQRTSTVTPISKGGTGATTAAAARTNLGVAATVHTHAAADVTSGTLDAARIPNLPASKITSGTFSAARIPDMSSLNSGGAAFGYSGGQWFTSEQVGIDDNLIVSAVISNIYALTHPVSTGYSSLYVNSDGRYGATPSAIRYKQDITPHQYTIEQLMLISVVTYRLKMAVETLGDNAAREVGVIAEQLLEAGLSEFVIFNAAGETQSVAYERLVLVVIGAVQELVGIVRDQGTRLGDVEARLAKLEGSAS